MHAAHLDLADPATVSHADLRTPEVARGAGGLLVAAGMFGVAAAAQVLALTDGGVATALAAPLALTGGAAILVAPHVYNGRGWATVTGTALAAGMAAAAIVWTAWSLVSLNLALALPLAAVAATAATSVLPFAVGPALRVSAARRVVSA